MRLLTERHRRSMVVLLSMLIVGALSATSLELCDFRIPTTDLTHLFLTANYTYVDIPGTPYVDVSTGRFSFTFSHIHDEPDRALAVGSTTELSFDKFRLDRMLGDASLTTRLYLPPVEPLYVFGEIKADYSATAGQPGLELRLGSGYGRLTDVTPLARALRIEARLHEDLTLIEPLSDDALLAIAALIGQEAEDQGIGELVSAIELIIEDEAAVTLNARSLLAIAEQIGSEDLSKQCGWTAQLGFGYELVRRFGPSRLFLVTLSGEIARPLSLASQVEAHVDFSCPLLVRDANALAVSTHYNRRLSDTFRIVAEYAWQRVRRIGEVATVGETFELQLLIDLGRIDLTVSGSLSRGTGMYGWVESVVIAGRVDLL